MTGSPLHDEMTYTFIPQSEVQFAAEVIEPHYTEEMYLRFYPVNEGSIPLTL